MARNHRDPPGEEDLEVQLDRMICSKCGSSTFDLGIAASDDPCGECGGFLMSRCSLCEYVACVPCVVGDILKLRKEKGTSLLAPTRSMGVPFSGQN
jgi:hypothetical protein